MSRKITKEIRCPHCKAMVKTMMWSSVNVTQDGGLRAKILDESLFAWRCPNCGYEAQLVYPCLYHDMERAFMVYLLPEIEEDQFLEPALEEQFPELSGLTKRLAADLNQFKEKILIFEAGLDDLSIELTKLALSDVMAKKTGQKMIAGYFCTLDRESNHIGFTFFPRDGGEPCYQGTRLEVYDKSAQIVRQYAAQDAEQPGFLAIDARWAARVLKQYHAQE